MNAFSICFATFLCVFFNIFEPSLSIDDESTAQPRCENLRIPFCQDLGYNFTSFPNSLNHDSQDEAGLEVHQFWPLVRVNCSPDLKHFLCALYAPECRPGEARALPPCLGLCQSARDGCEPVMTKYGFQWPEKFTCEVLPADGKCISAKGNDTEEFPITEPPKSPIILNHFCEVITMPMCQNIKYNMTIFPNALGHPSQQDAALELEQYVPLLNTDCSKHLRPFLCSIYAPVCTVLDDHVPPCRNLCKTARAECTPILTKFGFSWPVSLVCDKFPDGGLCIGFSSVRSDSSIRTSPSPTVKPQIGRSAVNTNATENEDMLFGKSIGESMKKYPMHIKNQIKLKIMQAFTEADEVLTGEQKSAREQNAL